MKIIFNNQTLLTSIGFLILCLISISCSESSTSVLPIEDELKKLSVIDWVHVRTADTVVTYRSGEDYDSTEVNDGYLLLKDSNFDRDVIIHSFSLVNAREISIRHDTNSVTLYY